MKKNKFTVLGRKNDCIELFVIVEGSKKFCENVYNELMENKTEQAKIANEMYDSFILA